MRYNAAVPAAAAVLASLVAPATCMFDSVACNGIGACTTPAGCNYWPQGEPQAAEWDCGTAGTINGQIAAGAELNFELGLSAGQVVAAADFPKCDLAQPSAKATLLKADFDSGVTVYGWIEYSCTETQPISDACYTSVKNPSTSYTCKVFKNGKACKNIVGSIIDKNSCPK